MKNIIASLLVVTALVSCKEAYETLSTPFKHAGQGLGLIGSTQVESNRGGVATLGGNQLSAVGAFEIDVKAPVGSVGSTAVDLFHKEARKACNGGGYKHKITHQGTTSQTDFGRNTFNNQIEQKTTMVPTVKGVVICDQELTDFKRANTVVVNEPLVLQSTSGGNRGPDQKDMDLRNNIGTENSPYYNYSNDPKENEYF